MKKQIAKLLIVALLAADLSACQQGGYGSPGISNETGGTLIGGASGALIGSQIGGGRTRIITGVAGGLIGALIGNQVGKQMDKNDYAYYNRTSQNALETAPTGQPTSWQNPDNGHYGTIVPTNTYQANGLECREYTQTINVGGQSQQGYGKACRQPDGTWQIQS